MAPNCYWKFEPTVLSGLDLPNLGVPVGASAFVNLIVDGRHLARTEPIARDAQGFAFDGSRYFWMDARVFEADNPPNQLQVTVELWSEKPREAAVRRSQLVRQLPLQFGALAETVAEIDLGGHGVLRYTLFTAAIPQQVQQQQLLVPRGASGEDEPAHAVVDSPAGVITEIIAIEGLYKPGHQPLGVDEPKLAEPLQGYTSDDDLGRIYLSRAVDGSWSNDTELIELTARVTLVNCGAPAGAAVMWTTNVEADTTLSRRMDVSDEVRTYLQQAAADINYPRWTPEWVAAEGTDLIAVDPDNVWATTRISVAGVSKIRLRCPKNAGDSFRVLASLDAPGVRSGIEGLVLVVRRMPNGVPVLNVGAWTGTMTMWHRIDVEYRAMAGALDLPVADTVSHFATAFIQADYTARQDCSEDLEYLDQHGAAIDQVATAFTNQEFTHREDGGWFCLLAIREFLAPPGQAAPFRASQYAWRWWLTHHAQRYQGRYLDYVDLSPADAGAHDAEGAKLSYRDGNGQFQVKDFQVGYAEEVTINATKYWRLWLEPVTVTKDFPGETMNGTNAEARARFYSPTGYQSGQQWIAGGFGFQAGEFRNTPHAAQYLELSFPGDFTFSGWSPDLVFNPGGGNQNYFAGRTIVATLDYSFVQWNDTHTVYQPQPGMAGDHIITIIHELTHGFGLPHRCSEWSHKREWNQSCVMNYSSDWIIGADGVPQPGTADKVGRDFCGRHLLALRRVRLERNPALMNEWA